ncbi:tyrosyl-DNA phosphodiesterase 1 isoform X2 [Andrographis paniculata]|uniref:tyrosyl-DNA phosphodiesterase 1 isoform X2 n=1 Tax=Andrographis paniculata TaxID=175694 RepID=UPI0021E83A3B|nr:tyrosyl-DNA phosphodiesterase 1 isoform X2 [Andrographis paniculata]
MAASAPLIGYLVPLNGKLEEEDNPLIPKIPLHRGITYVGRDCIPVADKRVSRKHLAFNASADGSADIAVVGTNPVVLRANGTRKKLSSGEKWKIQAGDVMELIPGHYFFKYVPLSSNTIEDSPSRGRGKRPLSDDSSKGKGNDGAPSKKRLQKTIVEEDLPRNSNNVVSHKDHRSDASSNNIRHFHVSKDKWPMTFRLLRVKELPEWANTNAVSIGDVIKGNVLFAVLSNYMVDIDWLLPACPMLRRVPRVLVIHGEGDGTLEHMKRSKPSGWILHKPPLPISYGTHHSKAMLLVYPRGVRVIVHTANLIYVDWNNKTQGLWMQDFPWKDQKSGSSGCGFENDLIEYLGTLKWPEFSVDLPAIGNFTINPGFFRKFDYSSAKVRLIASVPGYHSGHSLRKWGHMKLRTVLQECIFSKQFEKSPLIYQFSSLGSLDEKWMSELAASMSAGMTEDKKPLGPGQPLIVWPTVEDVRCSLEGYAAGNAIPSPLKNVEKEFLKKYWAKWKASHSGRCRAMPHIKTFARYSGQNIAWLLLTSSNLSKAAWGALQKNNSQLMIRSYELGVLFLPISGRNRCVFSCTDDAPLPDKSATEAKQTKLVSLVWKESTTEERCEVVRLSVPYELPPKPYSHGDVPWSWDRQYTEKDVYGQVWPRQVKLYSNQDF